MQTSLYCTRCVPVEAGVQGQGGFFCARTVAAGCAVGGSILRERSGLSNSIPQARLYSRASALTSTVSTTLPRQVLITGAT
jgi:hypothetical protein